MGFNAAAVKRGLATGNMGAPAMAPVPDREYDDQSTNQSAGMMPPEPRPVGGGATEVPEDKRLLIRTGYLSLVVKNVNEALAGITRYAASHGGFVLQSSLEKQGVAPVGSITFKIPSKEFDTAQSAVAKMGELVSQNSNGQDVTEEYVDLDSRLRNLRAAETQLLEIMKRAGKISDVLEVQQQLTQTRSQIEGITGRMKYLKQSSDFSTLTVNVSTDPSELPVVEKDGEKWKPLGVAKEALRSLVKLGQRAVDQIIWLAVYAPVWILVGLLIWLGYRKLFNKPRQ